MAYDSNGFWTPDAPEYDPASGGYQPPTPPTIQPLPSPSEPPQMGAGRWSTHLHNKPTWVTPENEAWAKSLYDNPDPNYAGAKVQEYLASQRAFGKTDEGDAEALSGRGMSGGRTPAPRFANTSPQFDDPSSRLVEDYALDRFQHLNNPAPNSGTALFEKYARELVEKLKGPVYSASDEAIIKTKATDTIMRERDLTKQRWLEEVSRRGIAPSSGIALDGIRKIDEHFNGLRTTVEADFARDAIGQTRNQRFQVLDTYGKLAGSEEGRMREAGGYASIPLELQNSAFQRNLQLVGAGGQPQSVLASLMQLSQLGQNQDIYRSNQRAATVEALLEYLGSLGY